MKAATRLNGSYADNIAGNSRPLADKLSNHEKPPFKDENRPMLPNWLVAFVLSLVAAWQIKRVLRYRANNALFIREVIGDSWIDKSRLRDAIRYYILREALFFISLPTFAVFSYVGVLVPYLLPIAISILAFYGLGFLWWERAFSAKKLKS